MAPGAPEQPHERLLEVLRPGAHPQLLSLDHGGGPFTVVKKGIGRA